MIKQILTFDDFEGNPVTEVHYFHLSKSDLIDMELASDNEGGMAEQLTAIGKSGNGRQIMEAFKDIVSRAYGLRDEENPQKFLKSAEISSTFMHSLAFDALFSKLLTDSNFAAEFVNGVIPRDLVALAEKAELRLPPHPLAQQEEIRETLRNTPVPLTVSQETYDLQRRQAIDSTTGLSNPRDDRGNLVSWAFRDPTTHELTTMSKDQMFEVFQRKQSGWHPRDATPAE